MHFESTKRQKAVCTLPSTLYSRCVCHVELNRNVDRWDALSELFVNIYATVLIIVIGSVSSLPRVFAMAPGHRRSDEGQ